MLTYSVLTTNSLSAYTSLTFIWLPGQYNLTSTISFNSFTSTTSFNFTSFTPNSVIVHNKSFVFPSGSTLYISKFYFGGSSLTVDGLQMSNCTFTNLSGSYVIQVSCHDYRKISLPESAIARVFWRCVHNSD